MCARLVHASPLRCRFCALLLVLVILSPCLQPYAVGATSARGSWTPPVVVDLGIGAVGGYAATALVEGYPAITYFDETLLTCKYVRAANAEGTQWGFPVAINATGIITANICAYESLSVVNGNPAFSYINDGSLRYVRALDAVGAAWAAPMDVAVASVGNASLSLATIAGMPAVAFYDKQGKPRYVRALDADGSTWGVPIAIDPGARPRASRSWTISLLTVQGRPAVAYAAAGTEGTQLRYVRAVDAAGVDWATPVIVDAAGAGVELFSMASVNGRPALSYNTGAGQLKFVRAADAEGAGWSPPVTLADGGAQSAMGRYNRLAVVDGKPAISYRDSGDGVLNYIFAADANGAAWAAPLVVNSAPGRSASLLVVAGRPAIAYARSDAHELLFVRAMDAAGSHWLAPTLVERGTGATGAESSLAVVNGKPAIGYSDPGHMNWVDGDLKYVRALDGRGATWGLPVTVDREGHTGQRPSLAVVNGKPAMCYRRDSGGGGLGYVRAQDADGASWDAPFTIERTDAFQGCRLLVIDGKPAIAYVAGSLRFVAALDADGETWDTPIVIDAKADGRPSMVLVNGSPAIAYLHETPFGGSPDPPTELLYVRATDVGGASWSTPRVLDAILTSPNPGGQIGLPGLDVAGGRPFVSYHRNFDYSYGGVRYVRAEDASGATWGPPRTIVFDLGTLGDTALAIVDGKPAIAYLEATGGMTGAMHYVQAEDAAGLNWARPEFLDGKGAYGSISMSVVDGRPAVSYPGSLRYVAKAGDTPIEGLRLSSSCPTELGTTTMLTATIAAGDNVMYQWQLGDGQNASGATVAHIYSALGMYTAVVTATNGAGAATATLPVTITAPVAQVYLYLPWCHK